MAADSFLVMEGITKSFPGVDVFRGFDFELKRGEIHCICGENGAGKSTLIKILSGAYLPDEGHIYLDGQEIEQLTPYLAMELGIQTIYQEHTLFPALTVTENLFVGKEICRGQGVIDRREMRRRAEEVLAYLHSNISPDEVVQNLGSGEQSIVEIARGLLQDSRIIILDEPTASFGEKEIKNLFEVLGKLKEKGISIIYISHHLDEVFQIADRVTVIRDGEKINTYEIEDLTEEILIRDMIGRDVSSFYNREETVTIRPPAEEPIFETINLTGNGIKDVSIRLFRGELLGIAGMVGSGRTELAELIFGMKQRESGEIIIRGEKVDISTPRDAIARRMCFITEDRQRTGLFLDHTIISNIVIANYCKTSSLITLPKDDAAKTREYVDRLAITTPSIYQKVNYLSGGNQQKVVLAKWFLTDGDIFVFDEPTRGIDIGAKEEIYRLMLGLLKQGKSIIMISSDMMELIAISDRINIMRNGKVVGELNRDQFSEENILKYSIGR